MKSFITIAAVVAALASPALAGKGRSKRGKHRKHARPAAAERAAADAPAPPPAPVTPVETVASADPIDMPEDPVEPVAETPAAASEPAVAQVTATTAVETGPSTRAHVVPELQAGAVRAQLFGSIRPMLGLSHHSDAISRDRWGYGVAGSSIDVGVNATAGAGVSGALYVAVMTDRDEAGKTIGKIGLERAVINYEPVSGLAVSVGRDGVPLSAQSATPTVGRVFPSRVVLNDTFVLPADAGAQMRVQTRYASAYAGVWNGIASDAMLEPGASERGLLYSLRIEATPLGPFEFSETTRPATLRLGIGAAATYRAATTYTPTGNEGVRSRDLRAAASIRAAWRGLFIQGEVLRKQVTDDLSMRPDVATGAYAQASWWFAAGRVGLAPLARAGIQKVRQLSMPATGSTLELGASVFPLAGGSDRLVISPLFARIVDPDLRAASLQAMVQLRLGF